jgi:hypothetical protein
MNSEFNNPEVGRELKAFDLRERTVVVVLPPNQRIIFTVWVTFASTECVEFLAADLDPRWTVINFVQADGSLHDDQGRLVRVFEYLGKN